MNLLFLSIFFLSCGANTYNAPFVNAEETTKLTFGMSREEVVNVMSNPLFVSYGDDNEIVWVYEVRTIEVNSIVTPNGQIIPQKSNLKTKHAIPLHRLALTFKNNKLSHWEPYNESK